MPDQHVVYLDTHDLEELAQVISSAAANAYTARVWVDEGGLKYSVNRRTWSYPPLGSTANPSDF